MKKAIVNILIGSAVLIAFAATPGRSSSGAPASHTGAPNEKTCATSGCHDDGKLNEGDAKVSVEIGNKHKSLKGGKTYPVRIRITDPGKVRFGFQILALDTLTKSSVGKFTIVDKERTQLVSNMYELKNREYVTYTFNGTDAVKDGLGEWIVNWTAPENLSSSIVFFVGAVSANDDMSDKGDKVYTMGQPIKFNGHEK